MLNACLQVAQKSLTLNLIILAEWFRIDLWLRPAAFWAPVDGRRCNLLASYDIPSQVKSWMVDFFMDQNRNKELNLPKIVIFWLHFLNNRSSIQSFFEISGYIGTLWLDLAKLEQEKKETHRRSFLKLTISTFLFLFSFFLFVFSCFHIHFGLN